MKMTRIIEALLHSCANLRANLCIFISHHYKRVIDLETWTINYDGELSDMIRNNPAGSIIGYASHLWKIWASLTKMF